MAMLHFQSISLSTILSQCVDQLSVRVVIEIWHNQNSLKNAFTMIGVTLNQRMVYSKN